ncbi:phage tail tape measure protein [Frankia sp. AvcI1]|uniref:phage tail tape measure protein n=1 Tax=Frankia sp. AvcI1 TaxID=573496 RepID=UPI0021183324|nr:phage tail tape measure protein [Frankia sp. AvcI1]
MTVVGTAEILIFPVLKKFGDIGAQINKQLEGVGLAATGAAGQLGTAGQSASRLEAGLGGAGAAAAGAGGKLGSAEKATRGLSGGLGDTAGAAGRAGGALRTASKDTTTWGLGIAGAADKAKGFAVEATKLTSIIGVAGVAAALYKGTQDANRFDAELAKVSTQAGVSANKLEDLKIGVLHIAGKIGSDPDSLAESLFHVESNFSSMGISSEKALSLVETAAKGARVGGADLVDVTNALTAAVAAQIPGVQNLDEAMGYLNATVGSGDMSMQDLANAFGTGAVAVVKGYGLSIKDVGAALAVFGDNNIRGAQAGTQLRVAVQALAVPAKAGKAALEQLGLSQDTLAKDMQKGGLNAAVTDLHNRLKAAGISAQQQGQILTEAFGKKAGTGVNILIDQFDRLESKYPELEEGATKFGDAWAGTQATTKQKIAELKGSFDSLLINIGTATQGVQGRLAGAAAGGLQKLSMGAAAFANSAAGNGTTTSPNKWVGQVELAGVRARAEMERLNKTLGDAKKIVSDLAPTFGMVAAAVGGALIVGLHAFEGVIGLAAQHTTLLKTALITIASIMIANKVATLALTAAHAAANIVFLITDVRTSSMTVALGANSAAKTQNLIGTRLLTSAYNSSLASVVRATAAFVVSNVTMKEGALTTRLWAGAMALFNAVMSVNPVVLIVVGIIALGVALYEAYRHITPFREAVQAVGRALETAGKAVAHVAVAFGHDLVVAFRAVEGAAGVVGRFFVRIYNDVKHWLGVALDFVKTWWPVLAVVMTGGAALIPVLIIKYWRQILDFTVRIFTDVKDLVTRIFKDVYNAVASVVTAVVDFVGRHWRLLLVIIGGPIGLIIVLIVNAKDKIAAAFFDMWNSVSGFAVRMWHDVSGDFSKLWSEVSAIAVRIWHDVSSPFVRLGTDVAGIATGIWRDVAGAITGLWRDATNIAARIWHEVAGAFTSLWREVSGVMTNLWHDAVRIISDLLRDAVGLATRIWHEATSPFVSLWHEASGAVTSLWHEATGTLSNLWRDATGLAARIWHDVSSPFTSLWHEMTTTASNLWKDVTGWFERIKNDITNSVKTATGWIKGAWDGLKEIFKAPINFLINPVYNSGIRSVWNAFAPIVREDPLPHVNGFAEGGPITGGRPGRDSVLAMLMPGEHVWTAAEVAAAGGQQAMFALRRLFGGGRQARGIGMADGGDTSILGKIGNAILHPIDALEALGSGTLDVLGTAVHWVRGALADAAQAAFIPIRAAVNGTLGTGEDWKGAAGRLAERPMDAIVNLLRGQDGKDKAAAATAPVAAAPTGDIQAYAMQLLTQHGWANQWNAFNALEMGEAGWNPAALNRSSGAYGLAQALPASKYDSYGNRNDYHVQLRWMLDYIGQRYGSPANAYSTWLSRDPHWYDQGGPLRPGLTLAANGTGRDEWVVPKSAVTVADRRAAGVTLTLNIDARGSSDPATVERAVRKASADLVATLDQMLQQGVGGGA